MTITVQQKNPKALDDIAKRLTEACGREIAVGYPRGKCQAYPEGGESVAEIAAIQVYGLGNVPARDFMTFGRHLIEGDDQIKQALAAAAQQVNADDDNSAEKLMEAAGGRAAALIQEAIVTGNWTPNTPETIRRKGEGKKPLIDTSHMYRSTTFAVRERTRE